MSIICIGCLSPISPLVLRLRCTLRERNAELRHLNLFSMRQVLGMPFAVRFGAFFVQPKSLRETPTARRRVRERQPKDPASHAGKLA